jgi:hypothetical protein
VPQNNDAVHADQSPTQGTGQFRSEGILQKLKASVEAKDSNTFASTLKEYSTMLKESGFPELFGSDKKVLLDILKQWNEIPDFDEKSIASVIHSFSRCFIPTHKDETDLVKKMIDKFLKNKESHSTESIALLLRGITTCKLDLGKGRRSQVIKLLDIIHKIEDIKSSKDIMPILNGLSLHGVNWDELSEKTRKRCLSAMEELKNNPQERAHISFSLLKVLQNVPTKDQEKLQSLATELRTSNSVTWKLYDYNEWKEAVARHELSFVYVSEFLSQ